VKLEVQSVTLPPPPSRAVSVALLAYLYLCLCRALCSVLYTLCSVPYALCSIVVSDRGALRLAVGWRRRVVIGEHPYTSSNYALGVAVSQPSRDGEATSVVRVPSTRHYERN
jgi:hypothetical protein